MSYKNLLSAFTKMSRHIFKNNLTGIYLHGSYALGCFNPHKSDLDLLLVIEEDISDEQKMAFMKHLINLNNEAPLKGVEMSIVKREYCNPFIYPTPFELHFSTMHLQWFQEKPEDYIEKMNGTDKDLAAHITIINHYPAELYGAKAKDVFGVVPKQDYVDSILNDITEASIAIIKDPMYVILTLCRVLGYLKGNLILSKQTGGEWGLKNLPIDYHGLIQEALICYQSDGIMDVDTKFIKEYVEYMMLEIKNEKG